MQVVQTDAAKRQAMQVLTDPAITTEAILKLRSKAEKGQLVGRYVDTCFFGIIGHEMGMTYLELKRLFNYSGNLEKNPVEIFVYGIYAGQTPKKNSDVAHIVMWCDEALRIRKSAPIEIEDVVEVVEVEEDELVFV